MCLDLLFALGSACTGSGTPGPTRSGCDVSGRYSQSLLFVNTPGFCTGHVVTSGDKTEGDGWEQILGKSESLFEKWVFDPKNTF